MSRKSSSKSKAAKSEETVVTEVSAAVEAAPHNHEELEAKVAALEAKVLELEGKLQEKKEAKSEAVGLDAKLFEEVYKYIYQRQRSRNPHPRF